MPKLSRPSPALVISAIALFVAAGGGAWAADHVQLRSHASALDSGSVRASTSASGGRRGPVGPRGPRGPRGFTGRTGASGPQGPTGPSDGFVITASTSQPLTGGNDTPLAQLTLPAGATFIVTASTTLGNSTSVENPASCTLLQNSNPIGGGSADLPGKLIFASTITLTAAVNTADGSVVRLTCNPDSQANARNTVITAIKVGTLHTQTPTP